MSLGNFNPMPAVDRWGIMDPKTTTKSQVPSHSWTGFLPQIRLPMIWPNDWAWSSGNAPLAPSAVTTAAPIFSASSTICWVPPSCWTSSPTRIAGRLALSSICNACSTLLGSPWGISGCRAVSISTSATVPKRSVGISNSIGLGLRVWNRSNASVMLSGIDSTSGIDAFQSVTALNMPSWSLVSWVASLPLPMNSCSTLVVISRIGDPEK